MDLLYLLDNSQSILYWDVDCQDESRRLSCKLDSSQLMDMDHMWLGIYNRLECIETWDTNQSHPVRDFQDHQDLQYLAEFHPCTRNIFRNHFAEYMVLWKVQLWNTMKCYEIYYNSSILWNCPVVARLVCWAPREISWADDAQSPHRWLMNSLPDYRMAPQ